jgi:hypothetical protein
MTAMVAPNCKEYYPDIFERPAPAESPAETTRRLERNRQRKRLYLAVRHLLRANFSFDPDGSTTTSNENFPGGYGKMPKADPKIYEALLQEEKLLFASIFGILLSRNYTDASLGRAATGAAGPNDIAFEQDGEKILIVERFVEAVTDAVKRYNSSKEMFKEVFRVLLEEGSNRADDGATLETTLHTRLVAEVAGRLIDDRVSADHPQIRRLIVTALTQALSSRVDGTASDIDIRDIDLDAGTAVDIIADNVLAVAGLYRTAMLEEMKLFSVAEKVAEHFSIGMIPLSRGPAGDRVYNWIREAPNRFTEVERRGVYGRTLGLAQGPVGGNVVMNREFSDLWLRFCSIVSVLSREVGSTVPRGTSFEQALKSARDLAVNLSLHGYGVAHFAAVETQALVQQVLDMLQQNEVLSAYGVRDYLQLVDRLSSMYLGGSVNTVRYRTMAQTGFAIMRWLADRAPQLAGNSPVNAIDFADPFLVANVERWLAVTGTPDASLEKYTDPVDIRSQPSIPAFAPMNGAGGDRASIVRGALEQAGLGGLPAVPQLS